MSVNKCIHKWRMKIQIDEPREGMVRVCQMIGQLIMHA